MRPYHLRLKSLAKQSLRTPQLIVIKVASISRKKQKKKTMGATRYTAFLIVLESVWLLRSFLKPPRHLKTQTGICYRLHQACPRVLFREECVVGAIVGKSAGLEVGLFDGRFRP